MGKTCVEISTAYLQIVKGSIFWPYKAFLSVSKMRKQIKLARERTLHFQPRIVTKFRPVSCALLIFKHKSGKWSFLVQNSSEPRPKLYLRNGQIEFVFYFERDRLVNWPNFNCVFTLKKTAPNFHKIQAWCPNTSLVNGHYFWFKILQNPGLRYTWGMTKFNLCFALKKTGQFPSVFTRWKN